MLLPHVPKDGDLPLHEAARNGHVAVAHELLRRACRVWHCNTMWISCRARVPVDAVSRSGKTALHVACTWGQEAVVEAFRTTVSGERERERLKIEKCTKPERKKERKRDSSVFAVQ